MESLDMQQCPSCSVRGEGFYCSLGDTLVSKLDRAKVPHNYRSGQVIFYEGTPALAVYCIYSGLVKLYKSGHGDKETMIRLLKPGDILGYRAVISDEVFAATAEAVEDTTACTIPRETFLQMLREDPDLAHHMMARLAYELRVSEDEMMYRLHRPVGQRVARLLLILAERAGGVLIDLPVRREDLARMAGTSPETLSRTLHGFARRRILSVDRRRIEIRNLDALRRAAGTDRN